MEEINALIYKWQKGVISNKLDLSGIEIDYLPNIPYGIKELVLSGNGIKEIPDNLPESLVSLRCMYNWAVRAIPKLPPKLQKLIIGGCSIDELPENLPPDLQELHVYQCGLFKLPEDLPKNLKILNLAHNNFTEIPTNLPETITELTMAGNKIERVTNLPPNLKILRLQRNNISIFPTDLPEQLEQLWLGNNKLFCVPTNLPNSLKKLVIRSYNIADENQNSSIYVSPEMASKYKLFATTDVFSSKLIPVQRLWRKMHSAKVMLRKLKFNKALQEHIDAFVYRFGNFGYYELNEKYSTIMTDTDR